MKVITFVIIPIILLISVGTSVIVNSNLIGVAEEATNSYSNEYYDEYEEEEDTTINIDGKQYLTVEDYLNDNPIN